MKKTVLFFFFATVLVVFACSSDDDSPKRLFKAKINGTEYIFNTVRVEKTPYPQEGYTDITLSATINNDQNRRVSLKLTQEMTGPESIWYFAYFLNETAHPKVEGSFASNVSESTKKGVKGTFSGTVASTEDGEEFVFTDGVFDINY